MTAFTDFAENKLIDWFFRGQSVPALAASWYFGLLTANTNDAASPLTEVTGGGYARLPVARSLANFSGTQGPGSTVASSGTNGITQNNVDIVFAAPTADWGTVVGIGMFDAATGGNLWTYSALTAAKAVNAGDAPPKFPSAGFAFQWDN